MLFIILSILTTVYCQLPQINIFIAVQNQNETFMSVLPYIDTCNYNQTKIIPGTINMQPLSYNKIFEAVALENIITFWTPVQNGFDIALVLQSNIANYSGYLLYNSPLQYLNRQIIVYNIFGPSIIFYYVLPNINSQTLQLSLTINNTIPITLSSQSSKIVQSCGNINSSIIFLNNNTFLYLCSSSKSGFTFVPGDFSAPNIPVDTSNLQTGSYNLTTNPEELNSYTQILELPYNGLLLITTKNSSFLYLIIFNQSEVSFLPFGSLKQQLVILIDRIWGQQFKLQTPKWMDVYKTIIDIEGLYFPGDIISVYVDYQQDIYIQSIAPSGSTYLSALSNQGNVYWNISFEGEVFLYGSQMVFIYNEINSQVSTLQIQRPIYIIDTSNFDNKTPNFISSFNFTIQCQFVDILVNYKILWTTPEYPIAYVQQLFNDSVVTNVSVFSLLLSENYVTFGPDLKVIPNYPASLSVFVIDQTTVTINDSALGVIDVWVDNDGMFEMILICNTSIYQITLQNGISVLQISPCRFNIITSAQKISDDQIIVINQLNQTCICYMNFSSCELTGQINTTASTNNQTYLQTNQTKSSNFFSQTTQILFKKNLFGLIKMGYVISILQNNSAVLIDAGNKEALDMVQLDCLTNNSTNGLIYIGQFQSPVLILYCQGSSQLNQYLITNNQFRLNRIIPLYGFTARPGQYDLDIAQSFVFLQVDPLNQFYPELQNCCVLKLNFSDFTVSVINQVIYAQSVVLYGFLGSYNFVILNSNISGLGPQTTVTIYFINQWVSFNQTDHFQVLAQDIPINMGFYSFVYNFAFQTSFLLTYNLTNLNLNMSPSKTFKNNTVQLPTINFNLSTQSGTYDTVYNAYIIYNLSDYVCGAVFHNFFIKGSGESQQNLEIYQRDILIPYKMIGQIGAIQFIQIINPQNWNQPNLSLNNLLLIVGSNTMYVFIKVINNVQLINIANITLNQLSCEYYLYKIINDTSVVLTSECSGFNVTQFTPFITINYNPNTTQVTSLITQILSPLQLRDVFTILTTQMTMYVGILEGPFSTQTGRLVLCQTVNCSYLYISTSYSFLLQYNALQVDNQTYYIMALDVFSISIYFSPQMQIPGVLIPANYSLIYSSVINESYCSTIKIVNATSTQSYVILSCTQYYYLLLLTYPKEITIIQKFIRYCNCDLYDNFHPQIIQNSQGLMMFIAQCRLSDIILKIKAYEGFFNKSLSVHTGYMQIFTFSGPIGPNCSNDSISPVKIVTLQCQMSRPLIKVYRIGQNNKFLYSQINGILIDNYIQQFPLVQLTFRPESNVYTFPTITMVVANQFHTVYQTVLTNQFVVFQLTVLDWIIFFFYLAANTINLLCIICFFIQRKSLKQRLKLESLIQRQNNEEDANSEQNQRHSKLQFFSRSLTQTIKGSSSKGGSKAKSKSVQVELFFYKRPKRFQ